MNYSAETSMKELDNILEKLQKQEFVSEALTLADDLETTLQNALKNAPHSDAPPFWDPTISNIMRVPVADGDIRVIHYTPENPLSVRPVVFIPGWGVIPSGFQDFFEVLYKKIEFYYIETREKKTSHIKRFGADFSLTQKAKDIQEVIKFMDLDEQDFVLMGTCWGSAIILKGLREGVISAPTYVTVDPMHRLVYSKKVLDIAPFLPAWLLHILRPLLKYLKIRNMKAEKQKQRTIDFIDNAVIWKWKRAGYHCRNYELFGQAQDISQEVFIFNGTTDLIHDQRLYPLIAREMPNGRFFYLGTTEDQRERMMGIVAREFAQISAEDRVPSFLEPFEKQLPSSDLP